MEGFPVIPNQDVARILEDLGSLLEVEDSQPFRVRAYRGAADELMAMPEDVIEMVGEGKDLTELPGIGKGIAATIVKIVEMGPAAFRAQLEQENPPGLLDLLRVPGLGPKRVRTIVKGLKISSPLEVRDAAREGKLKGLAGFGEKTEATILKRLERALGE